MRSKQRRHQRHSKTFSLALARFEVASRAQTRALEKEWASYRKQHRLGVEGKALAEIAEGCRH
jgi:hypothetical protein